MRRHHRGSGEDPEAPQPAAEAGAGAGDAPPGDHPSRLAPPGETAPRDHSPLRALPGETPPTAHPPRLAPPGDGPSLGRWRRLQARLLGRASALLLRLQCASWRVETRGLEAFDHDLAARRPLILAFWHGRYVPLFALLRGRGACVFTSRSFRGEVISQICRSFGYQPVQIPDHGRDASLERMREALIQYRAAGIAVDGPLGPRHLVKRGAVQLAAELGCRLYPAADAARRSRRNPERWDQMEIPRLATRVELVVAPPLTLPDHLDDDGIAHGCARLGQALQQAEAEAEAAVAAKRG